MDFEKVKEKTFEYAHKGNIDEVLKAIQEHSKLLKEVDINSRLLLHWAALGGHDRLVRYLLENGQPGDYQDDIQTTPLILAASAGRIETVKTLTEYEVNINSKNQEGHSALQYAASKGWTEIVRYLLSKGADINISDNRGATPLHRCASKGNISVMKLLLDSGVQVNIKDSYGNTPLHLACEEGRIQEAGLLIKSGADITLLNKEKLTPFDIAPEDIQDILRNILN